MAAFQFKALSAVGQMKSGRLRAANEFEAEKRLEQQHYEIISLTPAADARWLQRNRVKREDLLHFVFQLEQLTRSRVPVIEALQDLRDSSDSPAMCDVLASIVESIESGKLLSEAFAQFPQVFDAVFIITLKVGEKSSQLDRLLKDLGETLKWLDELRSQTKKIMVYPCVVLVVILSVSVFLMVFLVPQLIPFIKEMGGEIPFMTRALIAVSNAIANYWYLFLAIPVALTIVCKIAIARSVRLQFLVDKWKITAPVLGNLIYKSKLARFANYFSLMYGSGISVLDSLKLCAPLMDNQVLTQAVDEARQRIEEGSKLSESFAASDLFPPLVVRMLRVGENTGKLDESLSNITYYYHREVKEAIDKIAPTIEPMMTVLMGLLMAWIMSAVLGPVYDTMSKLG
jgi:type IV pilus assembly protein PilC